MEKLSRSSTKCRKIFADDTRQNIVMTTAMTTVLSFVELSYADDKFLNLY